MTTIVKIHRKGQMTLPVRLRAAIGVAEGDLVEATVYRGKILLTPKMLVDRSKFPTADKDYTDEQRRVIDARLDESEEDLTKGRVVGPFDTADEMIASMRAGLKKRATKATKTTKPSR
jgi:AbrB family looped-hinge helix DNA binding protein